MTYRNVFWISLLFFTTGFSFAQENRIDFDKRVLKFDKVDAGELVELVYHFTNKNTAPLVFNNYKVACSCTLAQLPKAPIPPGDTGSIVVTFDTKGKIGYQQRHIDIQTNLGPFRITFKGVVKS